LLSMPPPISRVVITGGTHGNESNGVELARHLLRNPSLAARPTFHTQVLLTNTAAIEQNVRYVEEDLNRCFSTEALMGVQETLEARRAREINAMIGSKSSRSARQTGKPADLIIDLHNTTAATGVALLMAPTDELCHAIAAKLQSEDQSVRICNWSNKPRDDLVLLPSIAPHGMTFEVGPAPWGCLEGALYEKSLTLLMKALDYVELHNASHMSGVSRTLATSIEIFIPVGSRDYPRDAEGMLSAMIHPNLQGRDFEPLVKGDPIFLTHDLKTVCFEGERNGALVHPFFINEAAYYEKRVAFSLALKESRIVKLIV